MADNEGNNDNDTTEDGEGASEDPPATFTQDEVNRMVGKARKDAARTSAKDLADKLGMSVDEARTTLEAMRKADDETKTEAERMLAEAEAAKAEAEAERARLQRERLATRAQAALISADMDPGMVSEFTANIVTRLDTEADDDDIADAVADLKTKAPALFAQSNDTGGSHGTGRRHKDRRHASTESDWEAGKRLAEERRGKVST